MGLKNTQNSYNTLSDVADFFYQLYETNEIGGEIEINDKLPNDLETETNKWYAQIRFYGYDKRYEDNQDLCLMLNNIKENIERFETYAVPKSSYEDSKKSTKNYYNRIPLTKKDLPDLDYEERHKKHVEYIIQEQEKLTNKEN